MITLTRGEFARGRSGRGRPYCDGSLETRRSRSVIATIHESLVTTPTLCMNAYTLAEPAKRYPGDFNWRRNQPEAANRPVLGLSCIP